MDDESAEARRTVTALLRHGPADAHEMRYRSPPRTVRLIDQAIADGHVEERSGYLVLVLSPREDQRPLGLRQDEARREAARAVQAGHQTVAQIAEATGMAHDGVAATLSAMVGDQQAFTGSDRYALTPYGRAALTLDESETAILYTIAAGERGERRLERLQQNGDDFRQALDRLVARHIVRKTRRYYEIVDPAYALTPGASAPGSARLLRALGA